MSDSGNSERPEDSRRRGSTVHQVRLTEKKMAKKTNGLEDLVQEIEDLIAELAHLQAPRIEGLPTPTEQSIGEAAGRMAEHGGAPQAP
jgi:hypothetical protein